MSQNDPKYKRTNSMSGEWKLTSSLEALTTEDLDKIAATRGYTLSNGGILKQSTTTRPYDPEINKKLEEMLRVNLPTPEQFGKMVLEPQKDMGIIMKSHSQSIIIDGNPVSEFELLDHEIESNLYLIQYGDKILGIITGESFDKLKRDDQWHEAKKTVKFKWS